MFCMCLTSWARTALYYMSAACFSDKRNADLLRLNHVWVLIWGMRQSSFRHHQSYVWRPVPDGLIEVWDPWAAATSKRNEACQHDACPSRRGDKRDGARMILVSSGSGNHSLLSRWYLDLFYWKTQRNLNMYDRNFVSGAVNNYRHCQRVYDSLLLPAADDSVTVGALIFSEAGLFLWCTLSFKLF